MKYRMLWGTAVAGVALHLVGLAWGVYRQSGSADLTSPPRLLVLVGMAFTAAALLGVVLLWVYERGVGGDGRKVLVLRSLAVPSVALVAAGSVWLATRAEDASVRYDQSRGVTEAQAALHTAPILVASDAATNGKVDPESLPHSHTTTSTTPTAVKSADGAAPMGEGSAHTHGTEAPISAAQLAAASTFVAQVKASTAKYEDIKLAMADGYAQITQDLPGIAAHFVKAAYLADSVMMDPTKPEFLLYTRRLDGNWRLVGTMFYAGLGAEPAPNYFGALDAWHLHENLCFAAGGVRTTASQAECKGGLFVRKTNWQLHVWTVDDADGVFAHDYSKIAPGAFPGATRPAAQDALVRAQ